MPNKHRKGLSQGKFPLKILGPTPDKEFYIWDLFLECLGTSKFNVENTVSNVINTRMAYTQQWFHLKMVNFLQTLVE